MQLAVNIAFFGIIIIWITFEVLGIGTRTGRRKKASHIEDHYSQLVNWLEVIISICLAVFCFVRHLGAMPHFSLWRF